MTPKTARIHLDGAGLRFVAKTGSGHRLILDDAQDSTGPSPAELLPAAAAACTAMDVISILRKMRQKVTRYEVEAVGIQREAQPAIFTRLDITHVIEGPTLSLAAVRRAIALSATKYCSVGSTLSAGPTEIHHAYLLRRGKGPWQSDEVIVIGPFYSALAALDADVAPAVAKVI